MCAVSFVPIPYSTTTIITDKLIHYKLKKGEIHYQISDEPYGHVAVFVLFKWTVFWNMLTHWVSVRVSWRLEIRYKDIISTCFILGIFVPWITHQQNKFSLRRAFVITRKTKVTTVCFTLYSYFKHKNYQHPCSKSIKIESLLNITIYVIHFTRQVFDAKHKQKNITIGILNVNPAILSLFVFHSALTPHR